MIKIKKTSLTDRIIEFEKNKFEKVSKWIYVPSVVTSIFTIIFSLSIVLELKEMIEKPMLIVLGGFLGYFLYHNEHFKYGALMSILRDGKRDFMTIFVLLFTFTLSVGLSLIGIYLWINKSSSIQKKQFEYVVTGTNDISTQKKLEIEKIEAKYNLVNDAQYRQEYSNLQFNRKKSTTAPTKTERNMYSTRVTEIENKISDISKKLEDKMVAEIKNIEKEYSTKTQSIEKSYDMDKETVFKNNMISYLFMFLTLLNDFVAVMFARKVAVVEMKEEEFQNSEGVLQYKKFRQFLKGFLLKKKIGKEFHISEIVNATPGWDWEKDQSFLFFGVMTSCGIIEITQKSKAVIKMSPEESMESFKIYFDNYLEV